MFPHIYNDQRLNYVSAVKNVDNGIRRVMESLEVAGVLEHTIVIFSSDNGGTTGPGEFLFDTLLFSAHI